MVSCSIWFACAAVCVACSVTKSAHFYSFCAKGAGLQCGFHEEAKTHQLCVLTAAIRLFQFQVGHGVQMLLLTLRCHFDWLQTNAAAQPFVRVCQPLYQSGSQGSNLDNKQGARNP